MDAHESKNITLDMVRAGLHCSLRMSRQILPLLLMLGWKTFVRKETCPVHKYAEIMYVNKHHQL